MRNLLFITIFLLTGLICHGQLKPPQQTDTLIIKSVEYNYSKIHEENWPCKYILKSATHFEFGDQRFAISEVEGNYQHVTFYLTNDTSTTSRLTYTTTYYDITITFSGYTFCCVLSRNIAGKNTTGASDATGATGAPNAKLQGRSVIGALPSPLHNIKEGGKVVVSIKVDRDGTVVEAQPGAEGTNLTSAAAWDAAKSAAMKAQFNIKPDAPEFQYGTITYIFKAN